MEDKWYYALAVGVVLSFLLPIGYQIGRNQQYTTIPQNPDFQNHITGLNLANLEAKNYSYPLTVRNPYGNMSIRLYFFLFSDPTDFKDYVDFSCSVKNGTRLGPSESLLATFNLIVSTNPYPNGELYVRVGCLRVGVDY